MYLSAALLNIPQNRSSFMIPWFSFFFVAIPWIKGSFDRFDPWIQAVTALQVCDKYRIKLVFYILYTLVVLITLSSFKYTPFVKENIQNVA